MLEGAGLYDEFQGLFFGAEDAHYSNTITPHQRLWHQSVRKFVGRCTRGGGATKTGQDGKDGFQYRIKSRVLVGQKDEELRVLFLFFTLY